MEKQTQKVENTQGVETTERAVSKITIIKSFKTLMERLDRTNLLVEEDKKILKEKYQKAFKKFIETL